VFEMGGRVRTGAKAFLRAYVRYRPTEIDRRLTSVDRLVQRADPDLFAIEDLARYELRGFSQNGEDGVLVEILNRIGVTNRFFVEFGIQNGTEGNCVLLADVFGWSGVFIEADDEDFAAVQAKYDGFPVRIVKDVVTADRVEQIFREAGVPTQPDVVSIDIDGNDVYVWEAMQQVRPRVVVIEYNSGIEPDGPVAQPHDPARVWDGSGAFGSSLDALDTVARKHGYRLAHTDLSGTNAFYVTEDDWPRLRVSDVRRRNQNFGLTGIRQRPASPPGGWQRLD
jgi:hypothetical protein